MHSYITIFGRNLTYLFSRKYELFQNDLTFKNNNNGNF